jgi:hypothetical protein
MLKIAVIWQIIHWIHAKTSKPAIHEAFYLWYSYIHFGIWAYRLWQRGKCMTDFQPTF